MLDHPPVTDHPPIDARVSSKSVKANVPALLTFCLFSPFIFPSDMVIGPIGAVGFVAMIAAILLFGFWVTATIFGLHNPFEWRSPPRFGLGALWVATIIAYVAAKPAYATSMSQASADRFILTLCGMSGIILVIGAQRSTEQLARIIGALTGGATVCAIVAVYQFITQTDPMDWIRAIMIGWTENGGNTTFQVRSPFIRVAGSTFHPIELGVVSSMILPLSVWRLIFDEAVGRWLGWFQLTLIFGASIITVSRSAILALVVVGIVFVPWLPSFAKRWAGIVIPAGVGVVFVLIPGFVTIVSSLFTSGTDDPSLATRVNNYPRVEAMIKANPLTGVGPGSYVPQTALQILDNQYLSSAVNMGLLGAIGYAVFLALPVLSSLQVARLTADAAVRCLAGAISAAMAVAFVTSGTADLLSFPVFLIVVSAFVGLACAVWHIAQQTPVRWN